MTHNSGRTHFASTAVHLCEKARGCRGWEEGAEVIPTLHAQAPHIYPGAAVSLGSSWKQGSARSGITSHSVGSRSEEGGSVGLEVLATLHQVALPRPCVN